MPFKDKNKLKEYSKQYRKKNKSYYKQYMIEWKIKHPNYSKLNRINKTKKTDLELKIYKKIETFHRQYKPIIRKSLRRSLYVLLRQRISNFHKESKTMNFTVDQLLEKIGENPVCYLTGDKIDIRDMKSWSLDHIIPKSRGGEDTLDNCNITTRQANMMKSNLLYDEFISICEKVIKYKQNPA